MSEMLGGSVSSLEYILLLSSRPENLILGMSLMVLENDIGKKLTNDSEKMLKSWQVRYRLLCSFFSFSVSLSFSGRLISARLHRLSFGLLLLTLALFYMYTHINTVYPTSTF